MYNATNAAIRVETIPMTTPIIQSVPHSLDFPLLPPFTTTTTAAAVDVGVGIDENDEVGKEEMGIEVGKGVGIGLGTEKGEAPTSELYRDLISESLRDCEKMAT